MTHAHARPEASGLRRTILQIVAWRQRRIAQRRRLATLRKLEKEPDWLLDDIGLCRCDVRAELRTSRGLR